MNQIHPLDRHPDTLLSIDQAAPLFGKAATTVRVDVTRRPDTLPAITKIGRRVFFRVADISSHIHSHRIPTPEPLVKLVRKELDSMWQHSNRLSSSEK